MTDSANVDLSDLPAAARADPPRAHHYGEFYGLKPLPEGDRPLLLVHGNCQAESLRLLLQRAPDAPCTSVRIPPLHEISADEVPFLERLLERCEVLLTQPVSDGYHCLALGTDDVRRTAARARTVVFPVMRFAGLHPYQLVTSVPDQQPPVIPYHDLRTLLRAAGLQPAPPLDAAHLDGVSTWSTRALQLREEAAGAVAVHDLLRAAKTRATNTINHPGNPILVGLALRLQRELGWHETATDPGYEMLGSVITPLEREVRDAVDPAAALRPDWVVDGRPVADASIASAQLAWYHERPDVVRAILTRAAEQLSCLGVG